MFQKDQNYLLLHQSGRLEENYKSEVIAPFGSFRLHCLLKRSQMPPQMQNSSDPNSEGEFMKDSRVKYFLEGKSKIASSKCVYYWFPSRPPSTRS
jgi:hypothetical protein